MWRVIVITPEETFQGEVEQIKRVIECGVFRLHLRHPKSSELELRKIIEGLTPEERKRIVLHDFYNLVSEYGLGGAHLNGRHLESADICTSRSCHSLAEVEASKDMDYCFLSPIFDSVSKEGYKSNFAEVELLEAKEKGIINDNVIASINNFSPAIKFLIKFLSTFSVSTFLLPIARPKFCFSIV